MLESDASAQNIPSVRQFRNNDRRIRVLSDTDLEHIEADLAFYELVSLIFILVADDKVRSRHYLEVLNNSSSHVVANAKTDILKQWAHSQPQDNSQWRNKLIEGLCIIQAKRILGRLNLDVADLAFTFMTQAYARDRGVYTNGIVKILYYLCENLEVAETRKLIDFVDREHASNQKIIFSSVAGPYLELYLLHWICCDVIDVGEEKSALSPINVGRPCNLRIIIEFLKQNNFDDIKNRLGMAVEHFNRLLFSQSDDLDQRKPGFLLLPPQFDPSSDKYLIQRERAGILLIINQEEFHRNTKPELQGRLSKHPLEKRTGTHRDKTSLTDTFSAYNYLIEIRENLPHDGIINAVKEVVNQAIHYDSVIVSILSHGNRGVVYGADSVAVSIDDIRKILISRQLLTKPKILIVQACQGEETLQATTLEEDGPHNLPIYSDILTCVSSVAGFTSFRDTQKGSWFIQTLCKKLNELSDSKHFVDILTVVSREVQNKRGWDNECMVPVFESILRKDLYLPKRL